jgi:hypothetical protein
MRYATCTAAKSRTRVCFYLRYIQGRGRGFAFWGRLKPRAVSAFILTGLSFETSCEIRACAKVDSSYAVEVGTLRSTSIVENVSYFDQDVPYLHSYWT